MARASDLSFQDRFGALGTIAWPASETPRESKQPIGGWLWWLTKFAQRLNRLIDQPAGYAQLLLRRQGAQLFLECLEVNSHSHWSCTGLPP